VREDELHHVLQAAANLTGEDQFVVIGSQALVWQVPGVPDEMVTSMEVDIYPRNAPELADEIDGNLGEGSRFHETYGYWAHGVGPETPVAPAGWETRLVPIVLARFKHEDSYLTAHLLEAHDLVLAKLAAGRDRDLSYAITAVSANIVSLEELERRLEAMPESHRDRARDLLAVVRDRVKRH
jgi:hypothetical protein